MVSAARTDKKETCERLTNPPAGRIITVKSKPRTRLAPQEVKIGVAYATKRPSLVGSGGRLFTVMCPGFLSGSFLHNNRDSPLLYMKGQTHTHHPLSGEMEPIACVFVVYSFTVPLRATIFYRRKAFSSTFPPNNFRPRSGHHIFTFHFSLFTFKPRCQLWTNDPKS